MRFLVAPFLGLVVALSLFVLDHALIARDVTPGANAVPVNVTNFIRVKRTELVNTKQRELPKKPAPANAPPRRPSFDVEVQQNAPRLPLSVDVPKISIAPSAGGGPYLGTGWTQPQGERYASLAIDSEVIPIVRVRPNYPRYAVAKGLQGWVDLEFTILKDGTVSDISVLNAEPKAVFDQSAVASLTKWKFRPRLIAGQPIERRARQRINFYLDSG